MRPLCLPKACLGVQSGFTVGFKSGLALLIPARGTTFYGWISRAKSEFRRSRKIVRSSTPAQLHTLLFDMNLKLLLALAVTFVLQSTAVLAQRFYTDHSEILAVLQNRPLVVMLQVEDPRELKRMADKPADLAQYKANVALRNVQIQ